MSRARRTRAPSIHAHVSWLVDDRRVVSCLALAVLHDGAHVTTIEGLARDGELHPLQAAFIKHDAFQCGYCTAGQIMSGVACIAEGHATTPEDIQFWMSGNICAGRRGARHRERRVPCNGHTHA